jgi:hypothetical protein
MSHILARRLPGRNLLLLLALLGLVAMPAISQAAPRAVIAEFFTADY